MDMLKLALKPRLPFINVATDDVLFVKDILEHLADGKEVRPMPEALKDLAAEVDFWVTSNPEFANPKTYKTFKANNKSLVFVNTKPSVLHFVAGTLLPPKEMILEELKKHVSPEVSEDVITAFGGMTLKDTFEVVRLTLEREGKLTAQGCSYTRQSYVSKLRGIQQVDTAYEFYQVPSQLSSWCNTNLDFFRNPIDPSLTPRGLIFDGPPGTGKTGAAKFIAQELGMPLYRLDVGAMKGKYVGDSEGNLNAALTQIDLAAPCVVLVDEVEKIFSSSTADSSGVTTSLLGSMLWWLQEHKSKVFTVMTTNHVARIPPELYREGRIDAMMTFKGLQSIAEAQTFAGHSLATLRKRVAVITDKIASKVRSKVNEEIDLLFEGRDSIPQVKVQELVNNTVKAVLTSEKD